MYMSYEHQNDDSSSDDVSRRQLVYFIWMVHNIIKHSTIDQYYVNCTALYFILV